MSRVIISGSKFHIESCGWLLKRYVNSKIGAIILRTPDAKCRYSYFIVQRGSNVSRTRLLKTSFMDAGQQKAYLCTVLSNDRVGMTIFRYDIIIFLFGNNNYII